MRIEGKRVLLTGATGGLGRAIAKGLAGRGAKVTLSSRKRDELDALAAELPGDGHSVIVSDLAEEGAAQRLADEAGDVDILVANAALPGSGRIEGFGADEIARAVRVNLEAPMILARLLVPAMAARHEGHLVFVSSLSGKAASPRASIYNATKFGLRGFTLALRQDLVVDDTGIGASVVMPGFVRDAGMFADSGAPAPKGAGTATPEQVSDGVISAIEKNRAEVAVAPIQLRAMAHLAHFFPRVAARTQQGSGAKLADKLAAGQTDKR
jgi:short-subunit dehydrogenase